MMQFACHCGAEIVVLENRPSVVCWNCGRTWSPAKDGILTEKLPLVLGADLPKDVPKFNDAATLEVKADA